VIEPGPDLSGPPDPDDGGRLDLDAIVPAGASPAGTSVEARPDAVHDAVHEARRRRQVTPLETWVIASGLFALAVILPLLRQRGTPSWKTVWAEDGSIYAQQAIERGGLRVLFQSYAGYLQLPPRLLALPLTWLPVRQLGLYCAVVGSLVAAALAVFVYRMTAGWIESRLVRVTLASFLVLTPTLGPENTACIVNTIWVFAAAALFGLVSLRESRLDTTLRSGVVFLAATSTPLCILYIPVAIAWLLIRRTRAAFVVAGCFAAGLAVQAAVVLSTPRAPQAGTDYGMMAEGLVLRVFAAFLIGPKWAEHLYVTDRLVLEIGTFVVLAALVAVLWPAAGRRSRVASVVLLVYAVLWFVVPVWGRGTALMGLRTDGGLSTDWNHRFDVIPVILLGLAVGVLIPDRAGRSRPGVRRMAAALFVAQVALLTAVNFGVINRRSVDPPWGPKVDAIYAARCVGRSPDRLVTIPNNKWYFPNGLFPVTVPCRALGP
jgi:hypothetical protein